MNDDVRDQAARAARDVYYADRPEHEYWPWLRVVDAVVAVLAPEIKRPLQARIEELSGELSMALEVAARRGVENETLREKVSEQGAALALKAQADFVVVSRAEKDALQARIEELEELAGMWESRAKEVDAHRRALWDITGRDPKVWSEAHARAVLAKGGKP